MIEIMNNLKLADQHSGCSIALTMRNIENIYKYGWKQWVCKTKIPISHINKNFSTDIIPECYICFEKRANITIAGCNHNLCKDCLDKIQPVCPFCKGNVTSVQLTLYEQT